MRKVGLYMRVSTSHQVNDGQSLESQERSLRDYVTAHPDMVLVDTYIDYGISGTKLSERDELQRLLSDVAAGKVDLILFTRLDRFFRSVRHLMNTFDFLDRQKCEWRAIEEHHDNSTPTGKLTLTILAAFAEMESNMDSARIKDVMRHKRAKREWPNWRVTYGYRIVDKHAVADPERAPIAQALFRDYIRHNNISKLIRDYAPYGLPHSSASMKKLLSNRVYIGEAYGIAGYTEAIIDRETFDTVQRILPANIKKSQKHTYIFTGLMRCPSCGRVMNVATVGSKQWPQYKCRYHHLGQCDFRSTFSERKIEQYILSTVKDDLEQRYLKLKSVKAADNTDKINRLYRKIDRLKDLYVDELIDMETYKADLERYRAEISALEVPAERDTSAIEALLEMNTYEIYQTLDKAQKRRLWQSVIKSITPQPDRSFFVEYL